MIQPDAVGRNENPAVSIGEAVQVSQYTPLRHRLGRYRIGSDNSIPWTADNAQRPCRPGAGLRYGPLEGNVIPRRTKAGVASFHADDPSHWPVSVFLLLERVWRAHARPRSARYSNGQILALAGGAGSQSGISSSGVDRTFSPCNGKLRQIRRCME